MDASISDRGNDLVSEPLRWCRFGHRYRHRHLHRSCGLADVSGAGQDCADRGCFGAGPSSRPRAPHVGGRRAICFARLFEN